MVSFMDLFAGYFGDERRAKRGGPPGRATCGTAKPDRAPLGARPGRHGGVREVSCQPVCDAGRDFRDGRIVARLGGWSGYQRYGPAGPKTIAYGWNQFKTMSQGWNLRQNP